MLSLSSSASACVFSEPSERERAEATTAKFGLGTEGDEVEERGREERDGRHKEAETRQVLSYQVDDRMCRLISLRFCLFVYLNLQIWSDH